MILNIYTKKKFMKYFQVKKFFNTLRFLIYNNKQKNPIYVVQIFNPIDFLLYICEYYTCSFFFFCKIVPFFNQRIQTDNTKKIYINLIQNTRSITE